MSLGLVAKKRKGEQERESKGEGQREVERMRERIGEREMRFQSSSSSHRMTVAFSSAILSVVLRLCIHHASSLQPAHPEQRCQCHWHLYLALSMALKGARHQQCKHNMQVSGGRAGRRSQNRDRRFFHRSFSQHFVFKNTRWLGPPVRWSFPHQRAPEPARSHRSE